MLLYMVSLYESNVLFVCLLFVLRPTSEYLLRAYSNPDLHVRWVKWLVLITGAKPVWVRNCMIPYIVNKTIWYHTVRTKNGLSPCGFNVSRQMYHVLALRLYIGSNVSRPLGIDCVCISRQMYGVLWELRVYIASNVWRPLGIACVYRVKCMASIGNCACISRQIYGVLWELRLYIASNVWRPLGIASVYRVKCIVSFRHCVCISRQLVPGTQATTECLPRWMSPRWRWLWRCVYTCPPPAAWPCIPPSPARSPRAPTACLPG